MQGRVGADGQQPVARRTRPAPKPSGDGPRIQLRLRFVLPFMDFDFTEQLVKIIEFLIKLLDPSGDIEVVSVAPGSVMSPWRWD